MFGSFVHCDHNDTKRRSADGTLIAHRVKIKTDSYALRHMALSGSIQQKGVLAWAATDAVDDVLPLLPEETVSGVRDYQHQIVRSVSR